MLTAQHVVARVIPTAYRVLHQSETDATTETFLGELLLILTDVIYLDGLSHVLGSDFLAHFIGALVD